MSDRTIIAALIDFMSTDPTQRQLDLVNEIIALFQGLILAAGPKSLSVTEPVTNVTRLSDAERARAYRQRKKEATRERDDCDDSAVDNIININSSIQEGVGKGKPASRRGSRLPDDWNPSDELWAWGKEKLREPDLRFETAAFKDYWASKTGAHSTKLDWDKTWKNWVREAVRRRERFKPKDKVTDFVSSGPKRTWLEQRADKGAK